jgi:hypothetical protein
MLGHAAPLRGMPLKAAATVVGEVVLLLAALAGLAPCASAEPAPPATARVTSKSQLMAAYLFNFTRFVEWPAGAAGDSSRAITIGVVADDSLYATLASIEGKQSNGRTLHVQRFAGPQVTQPCDVLFIGGAPQDWMKPLLAGLAGLPVLTVGEAEEFTESGGVLGFFFQDNKLRFEIDVENAERAKLGISSQLLRLARVRRGREALGQD